MQVNYWNNLSLRAAGGKILSKPEINSDKYIELTTAKIHSELTAYAPVLPAEFKSWWK